MPTQKKEMNVSIGRRIKRAREDYGYTQEKLAELIGVSVQYVSDLERGKVGASVSTIVKICGTLHVSSDFLLFGSASTPLDGFIAQETAGLTKGQTALVHESVRLLLRAFALGENEYPKDINANTDEPHN